MQILIDTSAIIAVLVNEASKLAIIQATQQTDLLAPPSIHWEIANAFSAMFKRERLSLPEALTAVEIYQQIPIRFIEIELEESLRIAAELDIYAYDAYLLRGAVKYNLPILTLDQGLKEKAERLGVKVIEVQK
ncbi:MAG: type II toxin-antitoxin system VapC family toxin [Ardenticatenaceae bacterium]|nr:type II toxin-antitoxin system VapC family toxin [Ardenticatenaceae bacterium]